jgi:CheY-like chemotaxis protein
LQQAGIYYWEYQNNDEAIRYFTQSLKLNQEVGNNNAIRILNKNLGLIYSDNEEYDKSLEFLRKSLNANKTLNKKQEIISDQLAIGAVESYKGNYSATIAITQEALTGAKEINNLSLIKNCYSQLAEAYENNGDSEKSFEYFNQYTTIQKHIQASELADLEQRSKQVEQKITEKNQELAVAQTKASEAQNIASDAIEKKEQAEQEAEKLTEENQLKEAQLKANRYLLWIMAGGAVLMVIIALLIFVQFTMKKKANSLLKKQHAEILAQKSEIEKQHEIVNKQKQKITDSILYASRIQQAILPPEDFVKTLSDDFFILFKPRDIVSGDFYWMTKKENLIVVAAADCTGHGVPGAFMSMLGVAFLNEIVNKVSINKHLNALSTDEVLNKLRENVISSLHQTGNRKEPKDGMDIALCIIDTENMKLQFSGAHNPLYIIRDNELMQYAGDKMPISYYELGDKSFTRYDIDIKANDKIYLFSDGYVDQFGGPKGRKFLSKNFRKLLTEICDKPLIEQKDILDKHLEEWKGDRNQLDDILVIGMNIQPALVQAKKQEKGVWSDKTILIAEDTDVNYFLLVEALRKTQVGIVRAIDGSEAVDYCKRRDFDLILMDINMPVMDGHEATRQIKLLKPTIPIIVQTALYADEDENESLSAGADDYVSKPIDLKTFISKISKFIDN